MKHRYRNLIITIFILFITIGTIPYALGKTRESYLTSFILNNEIASRGFSNGIDEDNSVSLEATVYALDIIKSFGISPQEIEALQTNLEDRIQVMFDNKTVDIYNLYFLLESLNILEFSIDLNLINNIYSFLNGTEQIGGGFSFSNTSTSISLPSTYYAIQLYRLINKTIENKTLHKNWVLNCNNSDGGYGGNQTLSSTLVNTYFAASILDEMGDINALADVNMTLTYLNSFYVDNPSDLNNFGGYFSDESTTHAQLSSTYFCLKAISLINPDLLYSDPTVRWILDRQNFQDGGFADDTEGYDQKSSSVISTYYAFETLKILDPSLSTLSMEIWIVEFNYWILIILLGSIGLIFGIVVYIYRKRRI